MAGLFDPSRLYEALAAQGLLPSWGKRASPETGDPGYYSAFNRLFATPERNELAHEMTHAVQANLLEATARALNEKQTKERKKLSDQEKQFLEAYQKLSASTIGIKLGDRETPKKIEEQQKKTVDALYLSKLPKERQNTEFSRYRSSPNELQAWGVGAMSDNKDANRYLPYAPPHLDPSFTTEFDILLTMYNSLPKDIKEAATKKRKESINFGRGWFKNQEEELKRSTTFEDVFADPFKSTIK